MKFARAALRVLAAVFVLLLLVPSAFALSEAQVTSQVSAPGACHSIAGPGGAFSDSAGDVLQGWGGTVPFDIIRSLPSGSNRTHLLVKLGATAGASAVGMIENTLGTPRWLFVVQHSGTVVDAPPDTRVRIEDHGSAGWVAVVAINTTGLNENPSASLGQEVSQASRPLCNFPLVPPLATDGDMERFITRNPSGVANSSDSLAVWWDGDNLTRGSFLPPPANLTATPALSGSVNLSWDAVANATAYHIFVNGTLAGTTTSTHASVHGLAFHEYQFNVTAFNSDTESAPASVTAAPLSPGCGPQSAAPILLGVLNAEGTLVHLSWTTPLSTLPILGYDVTRSGDGAQVYHLPIINTLDAWLFTQNSTFTVHARTSAGTGPESNAVTFRIPPFTFAAHGGDSERAGIFGGKTRAQMAHDLGMSTTALGAAYALLFVLVFAAIGFVSVANHRAPAAGVGAGIGFLISMGLGFVPGWLVLFFVVLAAAAWVAMRSRSGAGGGGGGE